MFDINGFMIVLLSVIIICLLFIMYVMYVRIQQLLTEVDALTGRMEITGSELEQLTRNVEEYKRMRG
jgi:predicted Holliday junction resolvase-like endonuclease